MTHDIQDYFDKKKNLKDWSDEEFEEVVPLLAESLAKYDYHYEYTEEELIKDWNKLVNYIPPEDPYTASQVRPGIKLCQYFFPNFFDIESNGKTFDSLWEPKTLEKVLRWCRKGMSNLWMSWVIKAVYFVGGLTTSTMYRPHLAKLCIAQHQSKTGSLFDPCAGWGGRMLGTVAAGWHYIGCEPNKETYENLLSLVDFLGIEYYVTLFNDGAENFKGYFSGYYDMVLTSPPYYDLEIYSKDKSQSISSYSSYDKWVEGWLSPLVHDCLDGLDSNGLSCWNTQNIANVGYMVDDIDKIHREMGYCKMLDVGVKSPVKNLRKGTGKIPDLTCVYKEI